MQFVEPETVEEVVAALAADPTSRCLAGGATLVAMMNADLVEPGGLVSLRRVPQLATLTVEVDGTAVIGAMARHAAVARFDGFRGAQRIVRAAAARIGHPAVRNMGTIGGSICHADPSADYPTAITAAAATIDIAGPSGSRQLAAADFFVDWFETALEPGELVTAVRLPADLPLAGVHYEKFTRADGDFATVSVAAVVSITDGLCEAVRVAVGGAAERPVRDPEAEAALVGAPLSPAGLAALGEALQGRCNPIDDVRASAAYRLALVPRLVARAVTAAARDAEQQEGQNS